MITHPEDQEVSAKEDFRLIVILKYWQCMAAIICMEEWKEHKIIDLPGFDLHLSREIRHFSKFVLRRSVHDYVVLHMN